MINKIYTIIPALLILFTILIADQLSKIYLVPILSEQPIKITSFLNLIMVWNRGVSFGMASDFDAKYILIIVTTIIAIILFIWLLREKNPPNRLAMGAIIGGAIGNIIDRFHWGAVADFLDFHIVGQHWPAFNIADSSIVLGVFFLVIKNWREGNNKGEDNKNIKEDNG